MAATVHQVCEYGEIDEEYIGGNRVSAYVFFVILEPGESIEVRYIVEQTGIHTVNEVSSRRMKELLFVAILGGIWAILIIYHLQ